MLFNSLAYILFFAIVFLIYYLLPHRFRWQLLLASSLFFYMWWKAELVVLIIFSTFSNYVLALLINRRDKNGRLYLALSVIINFALLFAFKYLLFFDSILSYFIGKTIVEGFNIILPIGISFYTFQSVAYAVDIYKGKVQPEKNYLKFVLFITFFPQLVAGPIERSSNLMPQLFSKKQFDFDAVCLGFKIALLGFFKKMVIADRAALFTNGIFNSVESFGFVAYVLGIFLFAFQIYCDFSGYSDIAIGCSKMLGIDLMKNFNKPYLATGLKDFWRRWHISLSTWFKDYLYIPMGGNRVSRARQYFNLVFTFMVSGLWHGANLTFVLWGLLHGLLQVAENLLGRFFSFKSKYLVLPKRIITFTIVALLFAVFRANSISDVFYVFSHFFWGFKAALTPQGLYTALNTLPASLLELLIVLTAILLLMTIELLEKNKSIHEILTARPAVLSCLFYSVIFIAIFGLGVFSGGEEFIYFQF